jgi:four helix bundle protein
MDLTECVYRLTGSFPRDELFGLTSQLRRASVSVPANIAEGHGRGTRGAYAGFLRIARGSLREVETHMLLAKRLGMTDIEEVDRLLIDTDEIGRMLHALIARLREPQRAS